jgi:hypothetical protein
LRTLPRQNNTIFVLELFRNNNFVFTLLLIPYAILLRFLAIYFGIGESIAVEGTWARWIFGEEISQNLVFQIVGVTLVFLHAAMVNRLVIRNRMTHEMTLFPGVFYILVASFFPGYVCLSPILIANTLLLIGLAELFVSHKKLKTAEHIFSVGFWFSSAAIAYHGYLLLILFPILGLSMLRTVKWVNWAQFVIGLVTPVIITMMVSVLLNESPFILFREWAEKSGSFEFYLSNKWIDLAQLGFFGIWILASLLQYNAFTIKKNIHAQKKIDLCFWFMAFSLVCISFISDIRSTDWLMLAIPLSILIAMSFLRFRSRISSELIHFIMVITLLAIQILIFF